MERGTCEQCEEEAYYFCKLFDYTLEQVHTFKRCKNHSSCFIQPDMEVVAVFLWDSEVEEFVG